MTNRIKLARKLRGLSMDDLVRRMGGCVSKMSISKYERGIVTPNENMLALISKACNLPLEFFHAAPMTCGELSFRIDKDAKYELTDLLKSIILEKVEAYLSAEKIAGAEIPFCSPLTIKEIRNYDDMEKAAIELRRVWELGKQSIVSVYELLEMNGIKVIEFDYEDDMVDGLSLFVNDTIPCMLINIHKNKTEERKRFTALHELAHILFDIHPLTEEEFSKLETKHSHKPPTEESLANRFAAAMLMPAEIMIKRIGEKRESINLNELKSIRIRYGASIAAQYYRLLDLGVISLEHRNKIYNEVIESNKMEEGWGAYPIPEIADRLELFEGRNKITQNDVKKEM